MEIKLFGKSLFEAKTAKSDALWNAIATPNSKARESKFLPNFQNIGRNDSSFSDFVTIQGASNQTIAVMANPDKKAAAAEEKKEEPKDTITPKGVYELKLLNDKTFKLNTDPAYVDKQLSDFKDKLGMISSEEYDMGRGVEELTSIVMRLENRKKYAEDKEFFEEFPYTTTAKIEEVVKKHSHLKLGQVAQFIADMPAEAIDVMKGYNVHTKNVCGKQAVFYIIADKKDFENTTSRRDPILLAQSPFGHFWQILGAWDDEMMFLPEL